MASTFTTQLLLFNFIQNLQLLTITFSANLIGNYNDSPNDDNIMSNGKPTDSTNELGESWQVPDDRPEWVALHPTSHSIVKAGTE